MTPTNFVQRLAAVSLLVLLAACAGPQAEQPAPAPQKSPNDDKAYRLVTLDNGLQALLISDPEAPKAAASLDVEVGSGDNPEGRGGLAHFLEHMLFLGTEKYPDPAEYERFITEHGGSRNAYTSFEHTNYFFDVDAAHLDGALDRFAQFFIAPNFDAQYVERERNAVQAEYQMGLKSDGRRGLDVLQATMNPDHPFSQLAVGSNETLADRDGAPVRDDLLDFYARYYSANVMRLAVLGRESLDELEALVRESFAAVPNSDVQLQQFDQPLFVDAQLPMLITVEPTGTLQQLQVNFPVPDYRPAYDAKPMSYIAGLVGHEGEGSLLSQLKAENLAEGLSAGSGLSWRGGALFSVSVSLTDTGVANYERVLQLLFAYLDMLRSTEPEQRIFDEQAALSELAFRFQETSSPIGTVSMLSNFMHYYADEDILRGAYMMEHFEPAMINEALAMLLPERAHVTLTAPGVLTDTQSPYYAVSYAKRGPEAVMLSQWTASGDEPALHLPTPNPFIAENLDMRPLAPDNPDVPVVRLETERLRIWHRQAADFRVPKGALYVSFRSPIVGDTAEHRAAASLYTRVVTDALNEYTYPALLSGLNFSFYRHAQGISLRISGYDDKQLELLATLLQEIEQQAFDATRFARVRDDMVRELRNTVARRPSSQLVDRVRRAVNSGEYAEEALIDALVAMDVADLENYRRQFWDSARAEALVYGNHDVAQAEALARVVESVLTGDDGQPALAPQVLALDAGQALLLEADIDHNDAVVAWYLQGDEPGIAARAQVALTAQVLQSGFFQQLRTERQLGYVVSSFAWRQYDVPGLMLLIQSPSHDAAVVQAEMSEFLQRTPDDIDAEQFARHREALINDLLKPHENLRERAEFYWQAIAFRQWGFDQPQQLVAALREIDYDDWLAYFRASILSQPRSLIAVSPGARGALPQAPGAERFDDPDALRAANDRYDIDLAPL